MKPGHPPPPTVDTTQPYTTVYCDGSSTGRVGAGGWGWVTTDGREASGGALDTTNNRMELQAAHEAILALPGLLLVVCDSRYVIDGATIWRHAWARDGWRKPKVNNDLWQAFARTLDARGPEIRWAWVRGHVGYEHNERADALAKAAKVAAAEGESCQQVQ